MLLLLTSIQIDVVEMIIAISKDYNLFQKLKKLLPKLNDKDKIARINDKLCCLKLNGGSYNCNLRKSIHREYDKPAQIYNTSHTWVILQRMKRRDIEKPYLINIEERRWDYKRTNDFPRIMIFEDHKNYQVWEERKTNDPICVTSDGFRDIVLERVSVFDFI